MSRLKTKGVDNNQGEMASLSIIELMHQIVSEPSPRLGSRYDEDAQEFVDACLAKDPNERQTFRTLLVCFSVSHSKRWCVLISSFIFRNIDGWMTLEIQILMWQRGRARFEATEATCQWFKLITRWNMIITYLINFIVNLRNRVQIARTPTTPPKNT